MINIIFYLVTFIVVIWFFIKEKKCISDYQRKELLVVQESINELIQYKQDQRNNFIQAKTSKNIRWLAQHLKGESKSLAFKPEQDKNGDFILLSYPFPLGQPVPRSPVSFAPALLTAIGILGTFTGIFWGLQGVGLGNLSNPQELIAASQVLLEGMKTAFGTSLAGMGTAIFFIGFLSWGEKERIKIRKKLRKQLGDIAFLESPNHLLSRLDNEGNIEVAKTLQTVANNLSSLNADAIASAIKSAITSSNSLLVSELRQLRELQESQGQTVETLVKQLRNELIEPVVIRLDQSAALTKEASAAVTDLKNELGGISTSLAGAVETIQSFQQDTLIRLQEFAANLQSILGKFRTDTQGVMEQVAVEIQEAVNQSITGMEAQRIAFEASASQASQTFRGIKEDLKAALDTQAEQQKQMLQDVQTSTESVLVKANEAFLNQSNTLVTVGKEASGLMSEAKDNFLGTLSNIDGMLQNTRLTVQQELEQFRLDYQAALQDFFTQQNNLLNDTLGEQREGLAGVVVNLQQTFSEEATQRKEMTAQVDQSLDRIGETVKTVNTLASAMGMTSSERLGQLQELARTIGNEAHRVEHSYQNMTNQFSHALITGNEHLNEYLKQANETYTKSIQDADKAAAEVCTKLNETSHGLMSTAEFLVSAAKELKNSNGGK